ncbi:MAG: DUF6695 family protein [Flavobacteriaceae bacterium]
MNNTGIILTLAYPETIVMVAKEWYSPYMRYVGIGKKNYLRAGHAALVLIDKATGVLEYHDFGRYITSEPNGRVRGRETDFELHFPVKAHIKEGTIQNLEELLKFLAVNPKLTHGEGTLYASVCDAIDYQKARDHITTMQNKHFIRYAAFIKEACNCARFVTGALIAGVTNPKLKKQLKRSTWFTPSTIGNVVLATTQNKIYEISETGEISQFKSSVSKVNRKNFLDKLKGHQPNFIGTLQPKHNHEKSQHAQWLEGIAAGAWFELHPTENINEFGFRRISPNGHIDVHGIYEIDNLGFNYNSEYNFVHYSNCAFFHLEQHGKTYRFDYVRPLS